MYNPMPKRAYVQPAGCMRPWQRFCAAKLRFLL